MPVATTAGGAVRSKAAEPLFSTSTLAGAIRACPRVLPDTPIPPPPSPTTSPSLHGGRPRSGGRTGWLAVTPPFPSIFTSSRRTTTHDSGGRYPPPPPSPDCLPLVVPL